MTTTIEVYPSQLPGEPLERHQVDGGTLDDWLRAKCPSYGPDTARRVVASVGGVVVPPEGWGSLQLDGCTVQLRPLPGGFIGDIFQAVLNLFSPILSLFRAKQSNRSSANSASGNRLLEASVEANVAKLNGVIPELAGRHRVYPDYLVQARRYFVSPNRQGLDVLLCIGRGEFDIDAAQVRIGETAVSELPGVVSYQIFGPGQDVSGNVASRNWYNAPEVGNTVGSAGLRLLAGGAGTPRAEASSFIIDASSIAIPAGAGVAPQDWDVGHIVAIVARIRTVEVVDGGGFFQNRNRDYVRGSFGDLALAPGDVLLIYGLNDGQYRVNSVTNSVSVPGSASTVTAVKVAPLEYLAAPITMTIGSYSVTLDDDYADHDDLVAAINAQIGGAVASHASGVVTITEQSPFSGANIALGGYYDMVFGAAPIYVTGVATQSYDELTLDVWLGAVDESGGITFSWQKAASLPPGVFGNVEIQKARDRGGVYSATEYRITSHITGTILDGSGNPVIATIGWNFQRLRPDGSDDPAWAGFVADAETPLVTITLDSSSIVGGWLGPFKATPRNEQAAWLEVDVFAPQGMGYINDDGDIEARTKSWELQWRSNGGAWVSQQFSVAGQSRDQVGYTHAINLGASRVNVEVRMRRLGAEQTGVKDMDRLEWYGLRALLPAPASYPGVTTMALRVQGSDAIASNTENQINLVATRKLGGAASRSIEAWVRHVCDDIGYSVDDIDTEELARLGDIWDARGDWFDAVFGDQSTVKEVLAMALRVGYSELSIDGGRIRPVRDEPRGPDFEHMYTPENMTDGLKRQFTSYDPDDHDGVDVEYTDAGTWETETVECRLPGDAGTRVKKITADGVTDRTRAWRLGMRERRVDAYRRKQFAFSTEWDALNSRYLSYCALADDVPGYGRSALVFGYEATSEGCEITSSEPLPWQVGVDHVVALRRPDGTLCGPFPATRLADNRMSLATDLDFTPVTDGAVEPTHLLFGASTRWSYPALVTEISPAGATVDVTAVNYDERVYADDDNSPPD